MKKIIKWGGFAILLAALVLLVGACGEDNDPASDVDWTNYQTDADRAFMVRNSTNKDLVAFKGSLSMTNILGGIPASSGAGSHGIKKNPALFTGNQEFAMIILTKEQFEANIDNLSALEQTPFTRIYVFYNADGDNNVQYDISGRLGGGKIINIVNTSNSLNVEIRLGGIYGETIGYAPKGMFNTKLYVTDGDFDLFPVFKRYNALRDVVETIYPVAENGRAWRRALGFDDNVREVTFNVQDAINSLSARSSGVAWLVIVNQSDGAIQFLKGQSVVKTSTGVSYFNSGTSKTYSIEMPTVSIGQDQSGTFAANTLINGYQVGPVGASVPIKNKNGETEIWLDADWQYTVYVTGDSNSSAGLTAVVETDKNAAQGAPVKVDISIN